MDEEGFGYIDSFDRADPAIYQGLKLLSDVTYTFSGKVRATGQGARLFVKEQASGQLIASAECTSIDFETVTLTFKVPKDGNYHIGLERGDAKEGSAAIDDASLTAEMYVDVPEGSENILSTQKPDLLTAGDGINDMLGIAFSTTADGVITHVRMYTGAQESGVRLVGLWEEKTGKLLLGEILQWPITTGLEGWKNFELPKPVKVTKGTAYVVGVSTGPAGKYVKGTGQLASPLENGHLVTYSNSGRWRDIQNFSVDMPEHTGSSHYFRDIVFLPGDTFVPSVDERILALPDEITWEDRADVEAARAAYDALTDEQKTQVKHLDKLLAAEARIEELKPEMEFISILTTQTPVNVSNTFGGVRLFLGTLFSPKTSGVVTTVRAYIGPKESGTHYVALWEYDTAKLLTGSVLEWNIEAGKEGWQEFILPESVKLSSGTKYVVAVSAGPNVFSAQTPSSYATFPVNNAFFTTYAKSSLWADMAVHGQNMPASLSGECYFRDIICVPDDPNG